MSSMMSGKAEDLHRCANSMAGTAAVSLIGKTVCVMQDMVKWSQADNESIGFNVSDIVDISA